VESISAERRNELVFGQPAMEVRKLELHDFYESDRELFETWRAGGRESVDNVMAGHREHLAQMAAEGFGYRRVRVVSEPLSEYQRMAVEIANPDEQLRWLPRSQVSAMALPGNDCLMRDDLVVFNVLGGAGERADIQLSTDAEVLAFCNESFERAWAAGIPNGDYRP
jgi:hypothetical protein